MKKSAVIIFISIVTIIYSLLNIYLFRQGYAALPDSTSIKTVYTTLFLGLSVQFILSRILLLTNSPFQLKLIAQMGGIWLAATLYFLLFSLLIDALKLLNGFLHFMADMQPYKFYILLGVVTLVTGLLIFGYLNAKTPKIKRLRIDINKKSALKSLKLALVSDVHFGNIIKYDDIKKMIKAVENEKPDVFVMAGDFIDEGITPASIIQIKPLLDAFQPEYGKIAILGNHEYINDIERSIPIFKQLGIQLLQDEVLHFEDKFTVVGRDDYSSEGFYQRKRKTIPELVKDIQHELPVILMDHQPYRLHEAVENAVDLQLSGHTHHGQMFPLNYITRKIFEVSWGYLKKGNSHFYISSGYGTWGPRIRIGNHPEIVMIEMNFVEV